MGLVQGEAGEATTFLTIFMVIWIAVCLGGIIYSMVNLSSLKNQKLVLLLSMFLTLKRRICLQKTPAPKRLYSRKHTRKIKVILG